MAKIITAKSLSRYGLVFVDPDTSKNRIFIDNYGYDFDTLAPKWMETFYWQDRGGRLVTSTDYNDYGLITTGYLDGCAWAAGNTGTYAAAGYLDAWFMSLDYRNYPVKRILKDARNNIIVTYPRDAAGNGDYWMGRDMNLASQSYATSKDYQFFVYEQAEARNLNAGSWSYSTITVTVTATGHGFYVGDYVTISGATATTGAPNGTYPIQTVVDANTFTYQVGTAPTGTAGGTMNIVGTTYRYWGLKPAATLGTNSNYRYRYDYTYDNNNATAGVSWPSGTVLGSDALAGSSRYRFFLGQDGTYAWYLSVGRIGTHDYIVDKYDMRAGVATATNVLASTTPTSAATSVIQALPSNLRTDSSIRKVFYSGHYDTSNVIAPLRLVWNPTGGTVTSTQCSLGYPAGTTYSTWANIPLATSFDTTNGENAWWSRPHQFTKNGTNYITFTVVDKYAYGNSGARVNTSLIRTWLTFKLASGASDNSLSFHSGYRFNTFNSFPAAYVPFKSDETELALMSDAGTSVITFDPTEFDATSWSYTTSGGVTTVTVNKTAHGLSAGYNISVSGAIATANAPLGVYFITSVPDANSFTFQMPVVTSGTATGTMHVSSGWQSKFSTSVRARGYGVDTSGRLWLTSRNVGTAYAEVHMISPNMPTRITVVLDSSAGGTSTEYVFNGTSISTYLNVDAYDVYGNRLVSSVTLTLTGTGVTFSGNATVNTVTTSPTATTQVPITITGPGQIAVTTTVNP